MKVIQELATLYSALLLLTGESGEVGDLSLFAFDITRENYDKHYKPTLVSEYVKYTSEYIDMVMVYKAKLDKFVMLLSIITEVKLFIFEITAHFSVTQREINFHFRELTVLF